jgi:hypothetical protein
VRVVPHFGTSLGRQRLVRQRTSDQLVVTDISPALPRLPSRASRHDTTGNHERAQRRTASGTRRRRRPRSAIDGRLHRRAPTPTAPLTAAASTTTPHAPLDRCRLDVGHRLVHLTPLCGPDAPASR